MTRMIDTLVLARQRHPGAKHSLDALCARFGIDRSLRVKHGALIDAQLLAQVYVELTGGRQIGLSLATSAFLPPARDQSGIGDSAPITVHIRPPRAHSASPAETDRHAAFLRTISDPIWNRLDAARLTERQGGA
jgi:DNA polymerase-3 subunit epsilon